MVEVVVAVSLLFVHGIGRSDGRDPASARIGLLRSWVADLSVGLGQRDVGAVSEGAGMVYYRDWSWLPNLEAQGPDNAEPTEFMQELALEWLRAAARADDSDLAKVAAQAMRSLSEAQHFPDEQGAMTAVAGVLAALARVPVLAEAGFAGLAAIQKTCLWQVDAYVNDHHGSKRAVHERVTTELERSQTPRVILAHSLGSVVAYEAIHRLGVDLDLLITIGSPLGLDRLIYHRLIPPASYPDTVRRWINVADPDDPIAADMHLRDRFPDSGERLIDVEVRNKGFGKWHAASAYLAQDEVRRPIVEALL